MELWRRQHFDALSDDGQRHPDYRLRRSVSSGPLPARYLDLPGTAAVANTGLDVDGGYCSDADGDYVSGAGRDRRAGGRHGPVSRGRNLQRRQHAGYHRQRIDDVDDQRRGGDFAQYESGRKLFRKRARVRHSQRHLRRNLRVAGSGSGGSECRGMPDARRG